MWATMYDNPPILQWLLSNNHVTINQRETVSSKNATALHMGVKSFHLALTKDRVPEAIEFLVNHGANIEAVDSDNKTPLHYAAKKDENLVIANYLLDRGARVNTTYSKHQTPLIIAAKKGALVLVKLLLDHGANITIRDNDQKSALDYAREKGAHKPGYEEVIELLEQAEQRQ